MRIRLLETGLMLSRPRHEVFAFFSDAFHLNDLTPDWLSLRILTPAPIVLQAGTRIDYQLRLHGVPIRWQSVISIWEPPQRFVDTQIRGPYRRWIHEHTFEERPDGTWVGDRVEYAVAGWLLEPLIHRWLVGPNLEAIFEFRRQRLIEQFAGSAVQRDRPLS